MTTDVLTPTSFAGLRVEKVRVEPTFKALIYGESSIGKTTLAGGADAVPPMRKVLLADVEKGDLSLRKTPYRPDVVRLSTWDALRKLYHALLTGPEVHGYRTVIVDSLTEVNDLSIKDIMKTDTGSEDETPEWKHWNMNQVRVLRLLRDFRDLPMNVIFTALVKEDVDKTSGKVQFRPDLPGKLSAKVPAIFDNVFYYYMKEVRVEGQEEKVTKRLLLTTKTHNTVAKNRGSDKLPPFIDVPPVTTGTAPVMQLIYDAVIGGETL